MEDEKRMVQVEFKWRTLADVLKMDAHMVRVNGNKYSNLPYWFKELPDGNYELYPLHRPLPKELEEYIKHQREKS